MAKKAPLRVKASVNYASCDVISTQVMQCPLCGVSVPANTPHHCEKKS